MSTVTAADRITVSLIPKAAASLAALAEQTGLSKTDIVNRGLQLFEFIEAQMRAGNDLIVRDRKTGEAQLVKLL